MASTINVKVDVSDRLHLILTRIATALEKDAQARDEEAPVEGNSGGDPQVATERFKLQCRSRSNSGLRCKIMFRHNGGVGETIAGTGRCKYHQRRPNVFDYEELDST